jgi:lipopolysaccharide/colanic/teichoic acid biosynthesis glycosyltransferase
VHEGGLDAAVRRALDVLVSSVLLLALAPLLVVVALAVRATSPGPALFRQVRVGRDGRRFTLHKFRTMRADAPRRGPRITVGADPRVTALGAWLRRTKVDELPQLWDVLRGAMSLVGPRPEVPEWVLRWTPTQRRLLRVRPGITDPASLAFADEASLLARAGDPMGFYATVVAPAKLALSLAYLERRTVVTDVGVLVQTALRLVGLVDAPPPPLVPADDVPRREVAR